jgi:hypothetical protein
MNLRLIAGIAIGFISCVLLGATARALDSCVQPPPAIVCVTGPLRASVYVTNNVRVLTGGDSYCRGMTNYPSGDPR